ncbi:hypothetical protein FCH28_00435 [Streptomyces piniterrae]|uniref:Ig-like domain-containing protein n=1 Tax=Streptomyces piniterrae TaxID=2571125 RepID=A0A4U0NVH6_9ACTN|nr:hypothetical protein [Streptomyces piniterrae]TJZ58689.1 hypothetical protein FCH28_00435 [Streptomyces piniterrae]
MATPHAIRRRALRRVGALASGVLLCAGLAMPAATPAVADTGDLTCSGSADLNFSPSLTPGGTADVSGSGHLSNCSSLTGRQLTSASIEPAGVATAAEAPCSALFSVDGTGTFVWNDGTTSEFDFTINTDPLNGLPAFSAEVTSGPLAGDTITAAPLVATVNLDCATKGLTTFSTTLSALTFT